MGKKPKSSCCEKYRDGKKPCARCPDVAAGKVDRKGHRLKKGKKKRS